MDGRGMETTRERYLKIVGEKLMKQWEKAGNVEEKWNTLKSALCESAEEVLGHEDRKQPNCFRECKVDLKPLFAIASYSE